MSWDRLPTFADYMSNEEMSMPDLRELIEFVRAYDEREAAINSEDGTGGKINPAWENMEKARAACGVMPEEEK